MPELAALSLYPKEPSALTTTVVVSVGISWRSNTPNEPVIVTDPVN